MQILLDGKSFVGIQASLNDKYLARAGCDSEGSQLLMRQRGFLSAMTAALMRPRSTASSNPPAPAHPMDILRPAHSWAQKLSAKWGNRREEVEQPPPGVIAADGSGAPERHSSRSTRFAMMAHKASFEERLCSVRSPALPRESCFWTDLPGCASLPEMKFDRVVHPAYVYYEARGSLTSGTPGR